jgi:hypothetical protein
VVVVQKISNDDVAGNDDTVRLRKTTSRVLSKLRPDHAPLPSQSDVADHRGHAHANPTPLRAKDPLRPEDLKTGRPKDPEDPEDLKTCPSSPSSPFSGHDGVAAVACAAIDEMVANKRPRHQTGFWLAKRIQQYRLGQEPNVLMRAARAAVEYAQLIGSDDYTWDVDDLVFEMAAVWQKIKFVDSDVVLTMARRARARPGTFQPEPPEVIQLLVDTLWYLSQLGGRGVASPSQLALARALGREPRMVSRYLQAAEQYGLIECVDPKFIPGRKAMTWKVLVGPKYTPPEVGE